MGSSPASLSEVRIFIGGPIEYQSEIDALRRVHTELVQSCRWAFVFANFNVSSRQIDLTIFTDRTTLVIEAKGYTQAIQGQMNGQWEQHGPYGTKKIRNAYDQVLGARLALRDEMQKITKVEGYPNGLVVVMPNIPADSDVTLGDFKATVGGEKDIARLVAQPSKALLTRAQCAAFAQHLHLEEIESVDFALDKRMLMATRTYGTYIEAFKEFYGPQAAKLIEGQYELIKSPVPLRIVQAMATESAEGLLIRGPSGCGKTLLATACAMSSIRSNCIPIFVCAKDFNGQLQMLLDRELALLNSSSARKIISDSKLLSKRIILFLDGYNECRDDLKLNLSRSLKAFALRFGAGLVVSTQQDLSRSELLSMKTVTVMPPSDNLKVALARIEGLGDVTGNLKDLLQAVRSGLEAELVGQAGSLLTEGASRFALFDAYSRLKLGVAQSEGIRILSALASILAKNACFSISIREFDRLSDRFSMRGEAREALFHSQLLYLRGDRVSFMHELFYAAFAAEAVIRDAKGNILEIQTALSSPRFHSSRSFILGCVEDDQVTHELLENNTDPDLIAACYRGECGVSAQSIVIHRIDAILDAMVSEAKKIEFELIGEDFQRVTIADTSLHPDIKNSHNYFQAIGHSLREGRYFNVVMTACKYIDEAISSTLRKLPEKARSRKIPLHNALFSRAYVMDRAATISQLIYSMHSRHLSNRGEHGQEFEAILRKAWASANTPGQYYFLLGVTKFTDYSKVAVPYVTRLLQDIRRYPYHLQLDLIEFPEYLRDIEDPYRTQIIDSLRESIDKLGMMMNGIIIDTLNALGDLQDEAANYSGVVQSEIENVLGAVGPEADQAAWGLFSSQFDHPFCSQYWEELQKLDDAKKKLLLTKACRGAAEPYLSFVDILIRQLSEFNDHTVGYEIAPWTKLPEKTNVMPQHALEVFIVAHESLGRLGHALPESRGSASTKAARALLACGELFYWANRCDVEDPMTSGHINAAQTVLLNHDECASAGVLHLTASRITADDDARKFLFNKYPDLTVTICREALKRKEDQVSFFGHGFNDDVVSIAAFSIQVLGVWGDRSDLKALRDLCDDSSYGVVALEAIKNIEMRTNFR